MDDSVILYKEAIGSEVDTIEGIAKAFMENDRTEVLKELLEQLELKAFEVKELRKFFSDMELYCSCGNILKDDVEIELTICKESR